jgi:hypothetical protein
MNMEDKILDGVKGLTAFGTISTIALVFQVLHCSPDPPDIRMSNDTYFETDVGRVITSSPILFEK